MKKFRFSKMVMLLTAFIILIFVSLFFVSKKGIHSVQIQSLNRFFASASGVVNKPFSFSKELWTAKTENQQLRKDLANQESNNVTLQKLVDENKVLRQSLKIQKAFSSYQVLTAQVNERYPVSWLKSLSIDKGSADGISKQMLVTSNQGLVGTIEQVAFKTSQVRLLSSNRNIEIPVRIFAKETVYGILTDYDWKTNSFIIGQLSSTGEINKGDKVETSGLDGNSVEGILVGEVIEVKKDANDLSRRVRVLPKANLASITYVNVIGN